MQKSGVRKGVEYAILTDEMTKAWSGMDTRQYINLKGLKKENLRDNMSDMELILNMLAESTSTEISKNENPSSFAESQAIAMRGEKAAKEARLAVAYTLKMSYKTNHQIEGFYTVDFYFNCIGTNCGASVSGSRK